jgi:hypothetical protein
MIFSAVCQPFVSQWIDGLDRRINVPNKKTLWFGVKDISNCLGMRIN